MGCDAVCACVLQGVGHSGRGSRPLLLLQAGMRAAVRDLWRHCDRSNLSPAVCCCGCCRFASKLSLHVFESQGILQACSSAADGRQVPAAAVYVKVFARDSSGDTWFYK